MSRQQRRFFDRQTRKSTRRNARKILGYGQLESRILLAADIADRNLVVNGGFESVQADDDPNGFFDDSLVEAWTAADSAIGQQLNLYTLDSERGTVLEIDSTDEFFDRVFQNIQTAEDADYILAFDIRERPTFGDVDPVTNDLEVFWDGVSVGEFTAIQHWQTITISLSGDGDLTELLFCEVPEPGAVGGDGRGPLLDNVRLVKASESVIENGSFELVNGDEGGLLTLTGLYASRQVPGWAAMGPADIRRIEIADGGDAADGSRHLNLDTTAESLDRIYQDVATQADATYFLSFDMRSSSGQPDTANDVRVRWNNDWAGTFRGDADWQNFGLVLTADSALTRLVFREASLSGGFSTGEGPQIDNVRLYRLDSISSDLNVDLNGAAAGKDFIAAFNEGDGRQSITSGQVLVSNVNGSQLSSATVRIQNPLDSDSAGNSIESLFVTTDGTNIQATYNAELGILRLVGKDTVAHYQSVLRTLQYDNTSTNPDDTTRIVKVSVSDSGVTSEIATIEVAVNVVNDPPEFNTVINGPLFANIGQLFTRVFDATDPEGTAVTYTMEFTGDAGAAVPTMTTNGIFQWIPDQETTLNVTVTATDVDGQSSEISFEITAGETTDEQRIQIYLAENNLTSVRTDSGLHYIVDQEGNGSFPNENSVVTVNYRGTLLDGTEFDSGENIQFSLQGVIDGWTEGIPKYSVGGSGMLIIPSELGYGSNAIPGIPPNSILIFEVDLLSFV